MAKANDAVIGEVIGKLTIIAEAPSDKRKHKRVIVRCECGKENECDLPALRYRAKKYKNISCGKGMCHTKKNKDEEEQSVLNYYRQYMCDTKRGKVKYQFNLSYLHFKELVLDKCRYCGREPYYKNYSNRNRDGKYWESDVKLNGIDRIDSHFGYEPWNVITACKKCNLAKQGLEYFDFLDTINKIHSNRGTQYVDVK